MAQTKNRERSSPLSLAVASTVRSEDPVLVGQMGGVAVTDYQSSNGKATIDFEGVYTLSVKGINDAGNVAVAVGDPLFYVTGDTPVLSKKASGVFFGYALEIVTSGSTTSIMVRLPVSNGAGSRGYYGTGVFISAELTATGSAVSTAHGLGVVPSQVLVILTEFTSAQSIDVTEGTHTTTNVLVTIASGVKYKVVAYK